MKSSKEHLLNITLIVKELNGVDIPKDSLPAKITVKNSSIDQKKLKLLTEKISKFNNEGDEFLTDIFSSLHKDKIFNINVVVTSGVPAPYDAWTSKFEGQFTIFLNLDEWPEEDIVRSALPVIKHEVTHVLLEPLLRKPSSEFNDKIHLILVDEGIAHFIGHPGRNNLLKNKREKWKAAEKKLAEVLKKDQSGSLSKSEKDNLLTKANTGPYWSKYAAISGMFRAAKIYSEHGANGLRKAIQKSDLKLNNSQKF